MSHKIERPYDIVFSDKGKEWHGLAVETPTIDRSVLAPLFFNVVETAYIKGYVKLDGGDLTSVKFSDNKGIVADLRGLRDSQDLEGQPDIVPLSVMTEHYKIMHNESVFRAVEKAFDGVDHTVTAAGTLDRCRRFFVTVALSEHRGFSAAGDKFMSYVNFLTSHDGSLALQFYDSTTRIVCNNTLNMSLYGKKNMHVKIRHTAGADLELDHISEFLGTLLQRREFFVQDMERLAEKKVTHEEAYDAITGWQFDRVGKPATMSTRSKNAVEGIYDKFLSGNGNLGETRYDVLNGFTDYYSNGDGVGKQVEPIQRVANGLFGNAANLKAVFTNRLLQEGGWEAMVSLGRTVNGRGSTVFVSHEKVGSVGKN